VWASVRAAQLEAAGGNGAGARLQGGRPPSGAGWTVGWRVVALTAAVAVLDELVYHMLLTALCGAEHVPAGRPPKHAMSDADCVVCHGVGLDDAWAGPLETFCGHGLHGAHRRCMLTWVQSRQRFSGLCPACRSPIALRYVPWWRAVRAVTVAEVVRRVDWLPLFSRAAVTCLFVTLVSNMVSVGSTRVQHELDAYHRQLMAVVAAGTSPP
jgi:hypothetical protein